MLTEADSICDSPVRGRCCRHLRVQLILSANSYRSGVLLVGWVLQVEERVPLAAAEVFLFTWQGRLCFLPGPWLALGRWHLPKTEVGNMLWLPNACQSQH